MTGMSPAAKGRQHHFAPVHIVVSSGDDKTVAGFNCARIKSAAGVRCYAPSSLQARTCCSAFDDAYTLSGRLQKLTTKSMPQCSVMCLDMIKIIQWRADFL